MSRKSNFQKCTNVNKVVLSLVSIQSNVQKATRLCRLLTGATDQYVSKDATNAKQRNSQNAM